MAKLRANSVRTTIGVVVGTIVALAVGVTLYQMNNQVGTRAKAANPCESYGKPKDIIKNGLVRNKLGTVQSKSSDRFVWVEDGNPVSKVVVMCAGAKLNKRLGGNLSYAELKVGEKVFVIGVYGDATKTTILAASLKSNSSDSAAPSSPDGGQQPQSYQKLSSSNPFGVMISGSSTQIKVQSAKTLGAVYYRPLSVFIDKWTGFCGECDAAVQAGLKLLLTVRNNGAPQQPTTPPTDLNSYKNTLSQIVDKYRPEVLVIENEENSQALFYSGSSEQYLQELKAGCEVAHQKGIKCANGGLVSSLIAALVSDSYKKAGDQNKANEYLTRTLGSKDPSITTSINSTKFQEQIRRGKELLAGYRGAGADFMNFHWYIADTNALGEAVTYLKAASGLPVMTNEVGQQKTTDPTQVTNVMKKIVELGLPYAVWFSIDIQGYGGATGLTDPNGTLRPNGEAYAEFILNSY